MSHIKTWQERVEQFKGYVEPEMKAMEAEIADLRAALTAQSAAGVGQAEPFAWATTLYVTLNGVESIRRRKFYGTGKEAVDAGGQWKWQYGGGFEKLNMRLVTQPVYASQPPAPTAPAFPPRDLTKPAEQQGIFEKFTVRRNDGSDAPGGKHHGCRYFVIDLDHDQYASAAMRAYAAACRTTHPLLADDIEAEWVKADAAPWPLFDRKLAYLEERGYEVIGRILHKNGEYALFDSSCRWLTQPQYWRLMHEQDGSLFAEKTAPAEQGELPPLPTPMNVEQLTYPHGFEGYAAGQMRDYARAALAAARS